MQSTNPFAEDEYLPPPKPQVDTVKVVLLAIFGAGGVMLLMCGGFIGFGYYVAQQMPPPQVVVAPNLNKYSEKLRSGDYHGAIAELDTLLDQDPTNAYLHNSKAWLLATCPDDSVRDGEVAVEHGVTACEISNWVNPAIIDTLAAAYAESGDFGSATMWQRNAIEINQEEVYREGFEQRLEMYTNQTPYREDPVATAGL